MIPSNCVIVAMYGATVGQVGILKNKMTTNQAICGIFPNKEFTPIYLYHFLLSKKDDYIAMAAGGAQPNISQNIIRDTLVCCPTIAQQQLFAERIDRIASSFIQGFFQKFVETIGISGIEEKVEIDSSIENLK